MWCDVLCWVVLCRVVMWCGVMWCDVMRCDVMWCGVMWCIVMWCDEMRSDVLCCVVLCCVVLCCVVLCFIVLWCVVWCCVWLISWHLMFYIIIIINSIILFYHATHNTHIICIPLGQTTHRNMSWTDFLTKQFPAKITLTVRNCKTNLKNCLLLILRYLIWHCCAAPTWTDKTRIQWWVQLNPELLLDKVRHLLIIN